MQLEDQVHLTTAGISAFLERATGFLENNGVESRPTHHVVLIFEEILANTAMHGGDAGGTAEVRIAIGSDKVDGEIVDSGLPFDPATAPEPDVTAGIEDRPIGGLGLFLVKRVSSAFRSERVDDRNRTTFSVPRI